MVSTILSSNAATVLNVVVEVVSDDSVRVSWDRIDLPEIMGYRIYYSLAGSAQNMTNSLSVPVSSNSVIVDSLVSEEIYIFQVTAIADVYGVATEGARSLIGGASVTVFSNTQERGMITFNYAKVRVKENVRISLKQEV